ncbi:MAG: class I SAM-dependent DNA methyltransferase [Flavobacterium sp.]|uniref:class I SAM-dependent DNA methyltransferase n=1 Tax=Flavobacterium sp. TaxID=239 RepID=UPI003BA7F03A
MTLSWNEIKDRALKFSKEWEGTTNEEADAKPFLVEFFNVFGISSKRVSTFEHRVKKLDDKDGYIDLLWKGTILIEMKSRGKNLDKAYQQAKDYTHGLKQHELPKYILISDFENFRLYDLEEDKTVDFKLNDLVNNVQHFGYILGYQKKVYKEQDPANIKAAELMGKLHDRLEEIGYTGHPLEVYLVRILFCLFAEDTTIFEKQQFQDYIEQRTNIDGSDLAAKLQELFQVLNTPKESRFKNLDEQLADFPYVNGKLFEEILPMASFDSNMRQALLNCCYIDWSKISPAIFGSMFQSVMNPKERRNLGAHYTSETNILKLIKPLFLDDLWKEFESIKDNKNKLPEFHKKLSTLKFLDPACGCGNFLVITYRELRLLEFEVLKALNKSGQTFLDVSQILWINVDQFSGIEYEEFPARIAEVAMWLIDHQMNMLVSSEFGQYFIRLPLKKSANIVHANALRTDWSTIVSKNDLSYIIGNPPFIGHQLRNQQQIEDLELIFNDNKRAGRLDYVAAWYIKSAQFIQGTKIKVAFVSTNSIVQGEQTGILWGQMFNQFNVKIHFAHRTFNWKNEAKGNAAVHCVIVGYANFDIPFKRLFIYDEINGEPYEITTKNISPYLTEGREIIIESRSSAIHPFPEMAKGSQPTDGGNLILIKEEKDELISKNLKLQDYIKRYLGAYDLLNNNERYCLWFTDVSPELLREFLKIDTLKQKLENVRKMRLESPTPSVKKDSERPFLFTQIRQPQANYLVVPETSSSNRKYIPIAYLDKNIVASNSLQIINSSSLYLFGVLQSKQHNSWIVNIAGRLKNDIRYTPNVYHTFPFPDNPNDKQVKTIETAAQNVLDTRLQFPESSLADLYDPLTMPPALVKAHNELDKAVDLAYRPQAFTSEANRMVFLFELYEKYTADLFTKEKPKKIKKLNKN